jgi:predicted permease
VATQEDLVLYQHGEGTDQFYGARVTPGASEFFGMPALHGRVLQPGDYEPGASPVFVLRYKIWKQRFNGDLSILNKSFLLNGTARTLVGIMPPRFGWYDADLYIPEKLTRSAGMGPASRPNWFFLGHLKPGVTNEQAQATLTVVANRLAKLHPHDYPAQFTVLVKHIGDTVVEHFKATLYTVLAAVGLLLLIACSNVANLMLARATTREREFSLRAALGARRARLIRLLMIESLVLAIAGAALGTVFAWGGLKLLVAAIPPDLIPAEAVIQLNAPVLIFTFSIAALTALIFGLAPALQSSHSDINDSLRDSSKGVGSSSPAQMAWRRDRGGRSRCLFDSAGQCRIVHAKLRGPPSGESGITSRSRLSDGAGPSRGTLQNNRTGGAICASAAIAREGIAWSCGGSGVKPASALRRQPEPDQHRRKGALGKLAVLGSVRQRGIFPHLANRAEERKNF